MGRYQPTEAPHVSLTSPSAAKPERIAIANKPVALMIRQCRCCGTFIERYTRHVDFCAACIRAALQAPRRKTQQEKPM